MKIACPWCGARDRAEFVHAGDAHVVRPGPHDAVADDDWSEYLFARSNVKGVIAEQWMHDFGCRQWFNALRDTVTHEVIATYPMGEPRPGASP